MEHSRGGGAQQECPERPVPVRRHHDQIGLPLLGVSGDRVTRVAPVAQSLHVGDFREIAEVFTSESGQAFLRFALNRGKVIPRDRSFGRHGRVPIGGNFHHVEQGQARRIRPDHLFDERHGADARRGEIDGEQDLMKRMHMGNSCTCGAHAGIRLAWL